MLFICLFIYLFILPTSGRAPQVCCAWDLYITMYSSTVETADKISIPSVYVTMKDGDALKAAGEVDVEVRSEAAVSGVRVGYFVALSEPSGAAGRGGGSVSAAGVFVPVLMVHMQCLCGKVGRRGKGKKAKAKTFIGWVQSQKCKLRRCRGGVSACFSGGA